METPPLYRQLLEQLRQWIEPQDKRHLQGCAEIVAAILQSESALLNDNYFGLFLAFGDPKRIAGNY
jgi:hypothetical protein